MNFGFYSSHLLGTAGSRFAIHPTQGSFSSIPIRKRRLLSDTKGCLFLGSSTVGELQSLSQFPLIMNYSALKRVTNSPLENDGFPTNKQWERCSGHFSPLVTVIHDTSDSLAFLIYSLISGQHTPIHWFILALIGVKLFICTFETAYWWAYHSSGERLEVFLICSDVLFALGEIGSIRHFPRLMFEGFFLILFFISRGWRIVRSGVPTDELRSQVSVLGAILIALLFFSGYNLEYYWLTLLVLYFFIGPKVFILFLF